MLLLQFYILLQLHNFCIFLISACITILDICTWYHTILLLTSIIWSDIKSKQYTSTTDEKNIKFMFHQVW